MKDLTPVGYPVFGANGQVGFFSRYTHEDAEVLVTCRGATCGTVNVSLPRSFITSNSFVVLPRWSTVLDKGFLRLALIAADHDSFTTGTAQPQITLANFNPYEIKLPPINEQRRIVAKLEALQTRGRRAREALDAVPPLLEKLRQSILAAAFRGDLTKDWRAQQKDLEPATELFKRIRTARRQKWECTELAKLKSKGKLPADDKWKSKYVEPASVDDSDLPLLPDGWCWAAWGEVGFSQNGRAFPSSEYASQGVKLLRPGNLNVSGKLEWSEGNTRYMPPRWAAEFPEFVVGNDELLMNLTAQSLKDEFLGRVCLSGPGEECLLNQRLARLVPIGLPPSYWLYFFKSPGFRRYVDTLNTGSLIQHMFTSQLELCAVPLMPAEEAKLLVETLGARLAAVAAIAELATEQVQSLPTLDRALLAKAFRGELVPQDSNDEPAEAMLARARSANSSAPENSIRQRRGRPRSSQRADQAND